MRTFFVNLDVRQTARIVKDEITGKSISGTVVDEYITQSADGGYCAVLVLEKYYYRASNRASITVTIDNLSGETRIHTCAAGSSNGVFFRFDWGAGDKFEDSVYNALKAYERY